MYLALVLGYFANSSPLGFALYAALVLGLGLSAYSLNVSAVSRGTGFRFFPTRTSANSHVKTLVPSLSESMAQLHALQTEINELQMQFADEVNSRTKTAFSNGSANSSYRNDCHEPD